MERRWPWSSCSGTSLSTTQIKEIASQLSHHPQIHNFFRDRTPGKSFLCDEDSLKELGEVVAAAHEEAQGCREAVALALCALPCGNHFTVLDVSVPRNSGSAPFLALLADTNTCVLEELTFLAGDWFGRKAEWSLLAHLILHNTTLKVLRLWGQMSEEGGIALADSIRNNRGLQYLFIWDTDAFGKEGGGLALAAMLRHNSTLRTLELDNVRLCSRGTKALAKALLHNTTLKVLQFGGQMSEEGGIALADSIRNNRGLQELVIGLTDAFGKEGGGLALADMLRHNSTLRTLRLSDVRVCSQGAEALAEALGANRGLRELSFNSYGRGPVPFGSAIIAGLSDCVVETIALDVDAPAADAMIKLLNTSKPGHAGVSTASSAKICHNLQRLILYVRRLDDGMNGMDASMVADMIRSNQKLVSFTLQNATYSSLEWADTIIPALESNSTLKELNFSYCDGVDAELAYNALIRILSNNTTLESIHLRGTPLSRAGKAEAVDEELRRNVQYRSTLAALPKIKVKSCRLVLCGNAFAGKTTLCSTMLRLQSSNRTRFQVPQDEMGVHGDAIEKERTRGFEVNLLIDEDNLRVALWDFAGQPFYYALHDSVFPSVNGSTILLFVFSPLKEVVHTSKVCPLDQLTSEHLKSMQDFRDEFKYWLRFVSSNSRQRPSQPLLPSVLVVITFQDCATKLMGSGSTLLEADFRETVRNLQVEFQGFVKILGEPEFLDAPKFLDARSEEHVQTFLKTLQKEFVRRVFDLQLVPAICEKTRLHLEGWCSEHKQSPLMDIQDFKRVFQDLCAEEIEQPTLSLEEREQMIIFKSLEDKNWKVVALSLNDTGEVIYLDGLMDFIIVNPCWLGQGVMGHLVEEFSPYDHLYNRKHKFDEKKRGFVTTQCLKDLLKASLDQLNLPATAVTVDKLIHLLCNLHLCYGRKDEHGRDGYFIPVLFAHDQDKVQLLDRQLEWPSQIQDNENHVFFGARLECSNIIQTFLTPGLFPRIQVLLYEAGKKMGWDEEGMKMDVHLYGVSTNGYDVLIEYSDANFHIDLLVRSRQAHSTQDHFASRNFLYQHFIKPIRSFCASQEGCVGVSRQECVQRRTSCRHRTKQCVSKEDLKRCVLNAKDRFYVQQWRAVEDQIQDFNSGISEVKKTFALEAKYEYATLLNKSTMNTKCEEGDVGDVIILGSKKDIEILTQGAQLDIASTIMPFRHISLSIKDVSLWRRGIAKLKLGRVIPLKVHLGCECQDESHGHDVARGGSHDVVSQPGRLLYLGDDWNREMRPVDAWIQWILCLGFKAGVQQGTQGIVSGGDAVGSMPCVPTAYADVGVEFLENRIPNLDSSSLVAGSSSKKSSEDLRKCFEEFLADNANKWKDYYFRQNDALDRFRREFMLQEVEYAMDGQTLWICNACLNKMGNKDGYKIL